MCSFNKFVLHSTSLWYVSVWVVSVILDKGSVEKALGALKGSLILSRLFSILTLWAPIPQNSQTPSNNLSAICRRIVWVCLTILWDWRLKG